MWRWASLAAAVGLAGASVAAAQTPAAPPPGDTASGKPAAEPHVEALPPGTVVVKDGPPRAGDGTRPFGFTHVVVRLPDGTAWVTARGGLFCVPQQTRTWSSGQQQEQIKTYMDALRPEMTDAGFKVDGDPDNIFAPAASTADLQLAAVITEMHFDFCAQFAGYGNTTITGS